MTLLEAVADALETGRQFRRKKWGGEQWPKDCSYKSMHVDYCGQLGYSYGLHISVLDLRGDDWFMVGKGEPLYDDARSNMWRTDGTSWLTEGNC